MEPKEQEKKAEPLFTILHFNDVYDIQPNKKGTFGIVNFEAFIRKFREQHPKNLLIFSGDCLSPSVLSNIFEGRQMVMALNKLKIDMACYGNHEFDFDQETSQKLTTSCNFPWLLGNIRYKNSQFCLGNGIPYIVKQYHGLKIGFFGVGGEDWMGILIDEYEHQLEYDDVGEHSKKMCKILKQQQKCDMIIALTHMRVPQDKKLPFQAVDIDIVLGGHDHVIMKQLINGIPVLKSGDNFKTIGIIDVFKKQTNPHTEYQCKNFDFNISVVPVPIAEEKDIDEQLKTYVDECMRQYEKNDALIGYTDAELDTRFSQVRTKETNYGNFMADLARAYYDADCCVINSGSIRNDLLIKPGPLNYSVVSNIINDVLVVKEVPGSILFEMLQYACSNLPDTFAGSFLLVSGIKYTYDYRKHPRVQSVEVCGQPLDPERKYSMVTKFYLSTGGDGFSMIRDCRYIVDQVSGIDTLRLLLKFFKSKQQQDNYDNRQLQKQAKLQKKTSQNTTHEDQQLKRKQSTNSGLPYQFLKLSRKKSSRMNRLFNFVSKTIEGPDNKSYVVINPQRQGRIISLYP